MQPTAVLLETVRDDYLSFSIAGQLIHVPLAAVYLAIERDGQCMVLLRHEFAPPTASGAGWFVGFSVPIG